MWLMARKWMIYLQIFTYSFALERYVATRYSSVILYGYRDGSISDLTSVGWWYTYRDGSLRFVHHDVPFNFIKISTFFENRVNYNKENTSIEFLKVDLSDAGVYDVFIKHKKDLHSNNYLRCVVEVHDILPHPLIIQDTFLELNFVVLNCLVESGKLTTVLWLKEGNAIQSDETHKILNGNRTLIVNTQLISCALYTCVIRGILQEKRSSHLFTYDGMLLLHEFSFMSSVMALVSTTTSFAVGAFIICFAVKNYKGHKQHLNLTALFIFFQILAFAFLLTAALMCMCNSAYPVAYRLIEGFGLVFASAAIIYMIALYVRAEIQLKSSFLTKRNYRLVFWVYGIFSMIISVVPIHRGQKNITECQIPVNHILGTVAATVVIYVFILGISFILSLKYMDELRQRCSRTVLPRSWKWNRWITRSMCR
ncbi:uncharacterized protein LOC125486545 isoform X2 [Rhincodon typus]|uniref:uncharacterized protein LOC125486545 isoform X2 n=1 Tax=Rhincodon typus TaxID=259920 RepID=UPI00202E6B83|nr:uncharacterized protein LOC125486545 isoform X2 [Rhincodon typus]